MIGLDERYAVTVDLEEAACSTRYPCSFTGAKRLQRDINEKLCDWEETKGNAPKKIVVSPQSICILRCDGDLVPIGVILSAIWGVPFEICNTFEPNVWAAIVPIEEDYREQFGLKQL